MISPQVDKGNRSSQESAVFTTSGLIDMDHAARPAQEAEAFLVTPETFFPREIYMTCARSYTLSAADGRVKVTVLPGPPAYVYVTHDGLTEGDIDIALLDLTWHIPAPCCVIVMPQHGGKGMLWPVNEG